MSVFKGVVQQGKHRGRELGYPTINIPLTDPEASGVYAALVRVEKTLHHAAAFADPSRGVLEAHIFGISDVLYGREVTIELKQKIRDTRKYENDDALKAAIATDIVLVREYFHI